MPQQDARKHVGGSFAPPLDHDGLDRYAALAETANARVGGYMRDLILMLRTFWETAASNRPGTPDITGVHVKVPLEDAEVQRIWDVVPWPEELDVMGVAFDGVQRDECGRNTAKIQSWRQAVSAAILERHLPGATEADVRRIREIAKQRDNLATLLDEDALRTIDEEITKLGQADAEMDAAVRARRHDEVPYPALESTALRDAAFHLLWYGRELTQDREPMTQDKVGV